MRFVILSRGPRLYSTRRLAQAARARGHTVNVMDPLDFTMHVATRKPGLLYRSKPVDARRIDGVIPRIGASITFYGLAVVRQFEILGVTALNESQAIARSRDKLRSFQILSRHDVGLPETGFAHRPAHIHEVMRQLGGPPVVIKLLEGTQGAGVVLAETFKAAKSVLDAFHAIDQNILVQHYVAESEGEDIRALVVGRKVVAAMTRKAVEGEFRSNLHKGGSAQEAKLSLPERKTAVAAAVALGLNVAGVDILRSKDGPVVMEVNSSPGLEGIEKATKCNVADEMIAYLERNVRRSTRDRVGR